MKKSVLLFVILMCSISGYSQNYHKIDSIKRILAKFETDEAKMGSKVAPLTDTTKARILDKIALKFMYHNADSCVFYARQSLEIAKRLNFESGMADAYYALATTYTSTANDIKNGLLYYRLCLATTTKLNDVDGMAVSNSAIGGILVTLSDYDSSMIFYTNAIRLFKQTKNNIQLAYNYSQISMVYWQLGNYAQALYYDQLALNLNESLKDKQNAAVCYSTMGDIYSKMENYPLAVKSYTAALDLQKEVHDSVYMPYMYLSLADLFCKEGKLDEALKNDSLALNLAYRPHNSDVRKYDVISNVNRNIGSLHEKQGKYDEALKDFNTAIEAMKKSDNNQTLPDDNIGLGIAYEKLGNLQQALSYTNKALELATSTKAKEQIINAYAGLAIIQGKLNNYKAAYNNEVLYKQAYDSVFGHTNEQKLTSLQMQFDFNKQTDSTRADQVRKDIIKENEIKSQKRIRNFVVGGLAVVLFFLVFVFTQRNRIAKEKKRSEELLLNILPAEVADELKVKGHTEARDFDQVTVMFTDFKGFTKISEQLSSTQLVAEINYCFSAFDNIIEKYGIEKIKTIGDSYMCAGGLPVKNATNAEDVIKAAIEIRDFMNQHKKEKEAKGEPPFEIRIGVHTGPVVAGIVGVKKFAYDIWGDTVNLASRMESSGVEGQVNISESTYQLVKDKFTCTHRGKVHTKSKGEVDMYFVS